ncbi:MAG: acyltransferase family protein [Bacteroidales bacterium]|nr:acyltransferase family protein [Bacteroidales bacterium]
MDNGKSDAISVLKGIGIILMVIGHCAPASSFACQLIYAFHMPLFFFASGYCFKVEYLSNVFSFIRKRIKGLYFPFVLWGIIFTLLHNAFYYVGIINSEYGSGNLVAGPYNLSDIFRGITSCAVFRLSGYESVLLGAFWFLRTMFISSIFFIFLSSTCYRFIHNVFQAVIIVALITLLLSICVTLCKPNIQHLLYRELLGTFFISCGYLFREKKFFSEVIWLWSSCLIFTFVFLMHHCGMSDVATWKDAMSLASTGVSGTIVLLLLSEKMSGCNGLITLGNRGADENFRGSLRQA